MNHKSLLMFLWASLVAFQLTRAQSFCLDVGDGGLHRSYERVTDMVGSGTNIAFVGWDGYYREDMRTLVGKVSKEGTLIWMRSFNMIDSATYGNHELSVALLETASGNLVFASNGTDKAAIARCSGANGTLLQSRVFLEIEFTDLFEAANGNIIAFGNNPRSYKPFAMLLDANLNFLSAQELGFLGLSRKIVKVSGGYCGVGYRPLYLNQQGLTFSLSNTLDLNWVRAWESPNGNAYSNAIAPLADGSIASIGFDGHCAPISNGRLFIHRYSPTGVLINTKTVASYLDCLKANDALTTPGGMLVIAGSSEGSRYRTWAFSPTGSYLGSKRHTLLGVAYAVARNSVGNLFVGGNYTEFGRNDYEGRITRLNSTGGGCCSVDEICTVEDLIQTDLPGSTFVPSAITIASLPYGSARDHGVATMFCSDITAKTTTLLEEKQGSTHTLSPNPAHDQLQLDLPGDGPSELQLLDLQGRLLREASLPAGQHSLPVADLESGVYLLRIQGPGGLSTHKLSIQH